MSKPLCDKQTVHTVPVSSSSLSSCGTSPLEGLHGWRANLDASSADSASTDVAGAEFVQYQSTCRESHGHLPHPSTARYPRGSGRKSFTAAAGAGKASPRVQRPSGAIHASAVIMDARRKAARAIKLVAIAQQLARLEAQKLPSAAAVVQLPQEHRRRAAGNRCSSRGRKTGAATSGGDAETVSTGAGGDGCSSQINSAQPSNQSPMQALVGVRISVLRKNGDALQSFHKGTIVDVGREQLCQVEYDCGGKEWLALGQQHFRVLGPRASSAGCTLAVKEAMASAGALNWAEEMADAPAPCRVPAGVNAVGGRIEVYFAGDGHQHTGWVLAYNEQQGRHHVLYDDGEDEWMHLASDATSWAAVPPTCPTHGGLPPGSEPPAGEAAVGYHLAVYWKDDAAFYPGRVESYDPATGKHLVHYNDGAREHLCLRSEAVKWLHNSQVASVSMLQASSLHGWLPAGCGVPGHKLQLTKLQAPQQPAALWHAAAPASAPLLVGLTAAHAFLPMPMELGTQLRSDSPALLTSPQHPGSGYSGAWADPFLVTTQRLQYSSDCSATPSSVLQPQQERPPAQAGALPTCTEMAMEPTTKQEALIFVQPQQPSDDLLQAPASSGIFENDDLLPQSPDSGAEQGGQPFRSLSDPGPPTIDSPNFVGGLYTSAANAVSQPFAPRSLSMPSFQLPLSQVEDGTPCCGSPAGSALCAPDAWAVAPLPLDAHLDSNDTHLEELLNDFGPAC